MLKPGETFGRYTIERTLGQGGMGTVYQARDERLNRSVALKILNQVTGPEAIARALREARAAAAFNHPHGISIFDVAELNGTPYLVMELVPGQTLRPLVGDANIPFAQKAAWLNEIAKVLDAAHQKGLIHRDIKPENIMIREDSVLKVLDFGIAKSGGQAVDPNAATQNPALPTLTKDGVKVGTPHYMAPEQIRGEGPVDARADQFAWGVLAYELLTGKLPFRGANDPLAIVASILMDPADPKPLVEAGVPKAVGSVILKTLAKKPEQRYGSMKEASEALSAALSEGETSPKAPAPAAVEAPKEPAGGVEKPKPATFSRRYTTTEVREILSLAIDQQEKKNEGKLSLDDLVEAAREVGVDEDVLREASQALRKRAEDTVNRSQIEASRASYLRRIRRNFRIHAGAWCIVNVVFLMLGLLTGAFPWTLVPGMFWGIGLAMHWVVVRTDNGYEDEDEEADQGAWLRGKRRRFLRHLGAWVSVNVVFLMLGLMTGAFPWTLMPGLFWAIGLAIHGLLAMTATEDQWEDLQEKRRRRERRWLRKRGRLKERELPAQARVSYPALEDEAALLVKTGRGLSHKRVAVPEAEAEALAAEAEAEAEALAAEAEAEALAAEAEAEALKGTVKKRRR